MRLNLSVISLAAIIIVLGLSGCAGFGAQKESLIAYPPPPEEPRIVYLKSISGGQDLEQLSFLDAIFGTKSENALAKPWGVYGAKGIIYATDTGRGTVVVMDTVLKKARMIGDRGAGRLQLPTGIALAPNGILFVADAKLKRVYGFDSEGELKMALGNKGDLQNPAGLAIDAALGRLYLADSYGHMVLVYSVEGEKLFEFGGRGDKPGQFNFPTNIAVDRRNSNIYVTDTQNFRVQVFNKDGKYLRQLGILGDTPGSFSRPKGVAVDSEGHIYVADAAFNNIQVFTETLEFLLVFGTYGSGSDEMQLPAGLYIDEDDAIYLVDQMGRRILMYQYLGDRWKKEHPEEYQKYIKTFGAAKPKK